MLSTEFETKCTALWHYDFTYRWWSTTCWKSCYLDKRLGTTVIYNIFGSFFNRILRYFFFLTDNLTIIHVRLIVTRSAVCFLYFLSQYFVREIRVNPTALENKPNLVCVLLMKYHKIRNYRSKFRLRWVDRVVRL